MSGLASARAVKPFLLITASAAALALGAGVLARRRTLRAQREGRAFPPEEDAFGAHAREMTRRGIQYFVIPVWMAAGVADWFCHRSASIEETTGAKESLIHLALLAEAGMCVAGGLLLEVNAPVLGFMIASYFAHEATAMWDISYAATERDVSPIEQHVHTFLTMMPMMALAGVTLLHWPQFEALIGRRIEPPAPLFRRKQDQLAAGYVGAVLAALVLLEAAPYAEELLRDLRAHPGRIEPPRLAQLAALARTTADGGVWRLTPGLMRRARSLAA